MRYAPDHMSTSHRELLAALAPCAKQHGLAVTPLRTLMAKARRTTGTFYSHFRDRNEMLHNLVEFELECTRDRLAARDRGELQEALLDYLSPSHADVPGEGCVLPALAAEIARADAATRRCCEKGLRRLQDDLAYALGDPDAAWAVLAQAVGAVLLARTLETPQARAEVLAASLAELNRHYLPD